MYIILYIFLYISVYLCVYVSVCVCVYVCKNQKLPNRKISIEQKGINTEEKVTSN